MKTKIIAVCILILLGSCKSFKKTTETKSTKQNVQTEIKRDSIATLEINKPIKDVVEIQVPKSDNAEVQIMFERLLQQMNTSKTSGSNSYRSSFDPETGKLLIEYLIGQTENIKTATNHEINSTDQMIIESEKTVKEVIKRIPFWIWIIAFVYFGPTIFKKIQFFVNPLLKLINK
jgi:hypothetical protein